MPPLLVEVYSFPAGVTAELSFERPLTSPLLILLGEAEAEGSLIPGSTEKDHPAGEGIELLASTS